MDISAFLDQNILTTAFVVGQISEQVANVTYDFSKCKLGDLTGRLRDILLRGHDDQNHDLLRALLYAQCHALMAVCDTCLIKDYATEPALWRELAATAGTPVSRNPDIAVIARVRHNLAATARSVQTISIVELVALVGPALDDVPGLLALGREINACENKLPALRKLALERTRNMLQFSAADRSWWQGCKAWFDLAADEPTLPVKLSQRFEQHWPDFLRVTFRETLKGDQFPKARRAFELDVLSALVGVPQTLAEIETRLGKQEQMLNDVYGLLFNLYDEFSTQRTVTTFDVAQFKTTFDAWQEQLNRIETQATQAAQNSAAGLAETKALRDDLAQHGVVGNRRSTPDWLTYHRERVAEWTQPEVDIERRFVRLTLQFTYQNQKGEIETRRESQEKSYQGLDELLKARPEFPVLVVLGDPGCGKSTLLRHLQWWHSGQRLSDSLPEISLLVSLNNYTGDKWQSPREWLTKYWEALYPKLPPFAEVLQSHQVLFLLDALNEMKPRHKLGDMIGDWRDFAQELVRGRRHRIVFTCREDDYEEGLDCTDYDVPQVLTDRLSYAQMDEFIAHYAVAEHVGLIQTRLAADASLREFYRNPFFLKLLCQVVHQQQGEFPSGRASLFTQFVWDLLDRECKKHPRWLADDDLLSAEDHKLITLTRGKKRPQFNLPENGLLLPKLRDLAFAMQHKGGDVASSANETCDMINDDARVKKILQAGLALSLLDELRSEDLTFHSKYRTKVEGTSPK